MTTLDIQQQSAKKRMEILIGAHTDMTLRNDRGGRYSIVHKSGFVMFAGTAKECLAWLLGYQTGVSFT
jgi:hypothetical protein